MIQSKVFNKWLMLIAIAFILLMAGTWLFLDVNRFLKAPLPIGVKPIVYLIKPGTSVNELVNNLHRSGIIAKPKYFLMLIWLRHDSRRVQAGEYKILPGTTPNQLLEQIVQGRVLTYTVRFVEGWTFRQMLEVLQKQSALKHTINGLTPSAIMTLLGYPGQYPEGRFFPDTYTYARGESDLDILRQAYLKMRMHLRQFWHTRSINLPYQSAYEALIVASIIEKEARVHQDRGLIAGVILQRLQKRMPLQMDSTIVYGLAESYTGHLSHKDLMRDGMYNTYKKQGLPPTPIAMPGLASLQATFNPVLTDALYFVARGDGRHQFSSTLAEHNKAIRHYRAFLKKRAQHAK